MSYLLFNTFELNKIPYFTGSKLITTTAMTKQLTSAGHVTQSKQLTNSCNQLVPVPASSSNSTSSAGGGGRLCSPESTTSPPLIQSDTETVHGKNLLKDTSNTLYDSCESYVYLSLKNQYVHKYYLFLVAKLHYN